MVPEATRAIFNETIEKKQQHKLDSDIQHWNSGVENWRGMLIACCSIILRNLNTKLKKRVP